MFENPKRAWIRQLYDDYRRICYQHRLSLRMPALRVENFKSIWGQWEPDVRCITLAERLIQQYPWDVVLEILKHEMAHQMVFEVFRSEDVHGAVFHEACSKIGLSDWAIRACAKPEYPIPDWRARVTDDPEDRLLKKAEKLLALAASDNEHEALLAMQRVQELYAKYNLDRISSGNKSNYIYAIIDRRRKRIERFESKICSILTGHFFVDVICWSRFDAVTLETYKVIEILGQEKNVLMAEYVYHFLFRKLHDLWRAYQAHTNRLSKAKLSYMMGVLEGFDSKLTCSRQILLQDAEPRLIKRNDKSLMVINDAELDLFVKSRFPKIVHSYCGSRLHDRQSYAAGTQEGRRLIIQKVVTQSCQTAGKLLSR